MSDHILVDPHLDREYDNRRRVPEHPGIIAGWARDAEAFRRIARAEIDVPYGTSARQKFDFFYPDGEICGAALFIHGGYWQSLEKESVSHMAKGLTARGFAVAIPGYDLCPDVRVGDIVEQIASACVTAARHLRRPIVVTGHSAGGHLAAEVMTRDWSALEKELGFDPFPSALPISGLFDLPPLIQTRVNIALAMGADEAEKLSPIRRIPFRPKAILGVVGGDESSEYHRQTNELRRAWGNAGMEISARIIPGENHFTIIGALASPESQLVEDVIGLLPRASGIV